MKLDRKRAVPLADFVKAADAARSAGDDPRQATEDLVAVKAGSFGRAKQADAEQRILEIVISDGSVDRDRDIVDPLGWQVDNYIANPVVLWAHEYWKPPVARDTGLVFEAGRVTGHPQFHDFDAFTSMVYRLLVEGYLNATSVGFIPLEWTRDEERRGYNILRSELLEYSVVPVPANPNALVQARSAGIDISPLKGWAEQALDGLGFVVSPRAAIEAAYRITAGEKTIVVPKLALADGEDIDAALAAAADVKIEPAAGGWTRSFAAPTPESPPATPQAPPGDGGDLAKIVAGLTEKLAAIETKLDAPAPPAEPGGVSKEDVEGLIRAEFGALVADITKEADHVFARAAGRVPN